MAFGMKRCKVETRQPYSLGELLEAMKGRQFSAGPPVMSRAMMTDFIMFPPLDNVNQVIITGKKGKFTVERNSVYQLKGQNAAAKRSLLGRMEGMTGKSAKILEQLIEQTAAELNAMGI